MKLPEHVQINLDPNPADGGKTFLLVMIARASPTSKPYKGTMTIERDPNGITFAKDLGTALAQLYDLTKKSNKEGA